jgi:hypothetical protein
MVPMYAPCTVEAPPAIIAAATVAGVIANVECDYLVAAMFAESSWRPTVTGDNGRAYGLFQLHTKFVRAVWSLPKRGGPLAQAVYAGLHWRRLIGKFGRWRAAVVYACGYRCPNARWSTPARWAAVLRRLKRGDVL